MRMRKRKRRVIRLHGREMWEEKKTKRITALGERGARTGGTKDGKRRRTNNAAKLQLRKSALYILHY